MQNSKTDLINEVATYYSGKLAEHGETARGVDWNGESSQNLRFEQLSRVIDTTGHFSLNDLGCGYGALCEYLASRFPAFSYTGIDVSSAMIEAAKRRLDRFCEVRFLLAELPDRVADFGIASGIFNVRLATPVIEWTSYIESTLDGLNDTSRLGFSFNCLTRYSDRDKMRSDLYYADPCELFDLCKRKYSPNVALLHDYGLYEFTILVRKR